MVMTGVFSSRLRNSRAPFERGSLTSFLTGFPVKAILFRSTLASNLGIASEYETAIRRANFAAQAFTLPGLVSDS